MSTAVDNQKMPVATRLKEARAALRLTQKELCSQVGMPLPSLRDYELGKRIPGGEAVSGLVRAGINANWLLTGEGTMFLTSSTYPSLPEDEKLNPWAVKSPLPEYSVSPAAPDVRGYVTVPLYDNIRAAAGAGAHNSQIELADDAMMFKADWIRLELGSRPENLCLIKVSGDSMEPTLRAGDVILIDRSAGRPDREGIYVLRLEDALLVKRLQLVPGGNIKVTSDNSAFEPWTINRSSPPADLTIVGRVIWSGRRF